MRHKDQNDQRGSCLLKKINAVTKLQIIFELAIDNLNLDRAHASGTQQTPRTNKNTSKQNSYINYVQYFNSHVSHSAPRQVAQKCPPSIITIDTYRLST